MKCSNKSKIAAFSPSFTDTNHSAERFTDLFWTPSLMHCLFCQVGGPVCWFTHTGNCRSAPSPPLHPEWWQVSVVSGSVRNPPAALWSYWHLAADGSSSSTTDTHCNEIFKEVLEGVWWTYSQKCLSEIVKKTDLCICKSEVFVSVMMVKDVTNQKVVFSLAYCRCWCCIYNRWNKSSLTTYFFSKVHIRIMLKI